MRDWDFNTFRRLTELFTIDRRGGDGCYVTSGSVYPHIHAYSTGCIFRPSSRSGGTTLVAYNRKNENGVNEVLGILRDSSQHIEREARKNMDKAVSWIKANIQ